jgi:hypothetical protein
MANKADQETLPSEPKDTVDHAEEGEISLANLKKLQKSVCQICREGKGNITSQLQMSRMRGLHVLTELLQKP